MSDSRQGGRKTEIMLEPPGGRLPRGGADSDADTDLWGVLPLMARESYIKVLALIGA